MRVRPTSTGTSTTTPASRGTGLDPAEPDLVGRRFVSRRRWPLRQRRRCSSV